MFFGEDIFDATVPCNMKGTYKMLLWTTVYSPKIFYIYYNVMNRSHHVVFPAFQADVFMKVEPIKVHLVSYTRFCIGWVGIEWLSHVFLQNTQCTYLMLDYIFYYNTVIVMMVIYTQIQVDLKKTSSNLMNFFFFFRFWNGNCLNFSSISQNFQNCSFV